MEVSELIFKIVAYFLLIVFALMCVYPLVYALSSAFSSAVAVNTGAVILWPVDVQGGAFVEVLTKKRILDKLLQHSFRNFLRYDLGARIFNSRCIRPFKEKASRQTRLELLPRIHDVVLGRYYPPV